ncbi:bifunctional 2-polyprenyl-6-hydroxyphenol methylase/3-demethylubiquinol 3-O-methyltransferase UbiG [Mycolicibacterium sp. CR10]|uniref:class I SAM-dependent methyltransferase n=1 Tax=Mycolicibacterium sp. CR10 TaxID=2562314 RepID=UPI0010C05734|nr:class I SAM-dependent methyltransferase [Mycolicibacterium sp. CR10]
MSIDVTLMREAMGRRLLRRSVASGKMTLPAVPSLLEEYVAMCDKVFAALGCEFSTEELDHFRSLLANELASAHAASNRSSIVISYEAPIGSVMNYFIGPQASTPDDAGMVATRETRPFGSDPDARVWALAGETINPRHFRVLDISAGTGRNALALARRGHPVDVVELTPTLADMIRTEAQRHLLPIRVIDRDLFETMSDLENDYKLIVLSEVVTDFRFTEQLRAIFELAAKCLAPEGRLVFNTFLPRPGYIPDAAARELGQHVHTTIFTGDEIEAAAANLPLRLVADDSVLEYEKTHGADGSWPPTDWYAEWISGLDVFDVPPEQSPVELRWLVYQKSG